MPDRRRTAGQIRRDMALNRARLDDDLDELEERVEETLDVKRFLSRHPVLTSAAGAVLGFIVFRRPALVTKSLGRLAQLGAPFLVKALFQPSGRDSGPPESESSERP